MMNIFLETERLIVTVPQEEDFEDQYRLQSSPEVMRYIEDGPRTQEKVRERLAELIDHYQKHGFSIGSVFEKERGNFVGRAGLIYLEDITPDEIEVGYALLKEYWGRGYATELCRALLEWGFENLDVDKLVAVAQPENTRSRRVLEKSGMEYCGLKHCYDTEASYYVKERKS